MRFIALFLVLVCQIYAVSLTEIRDDFNSANYAKVCNQKVEEFLKTQSNEEQISMFGIACIKMNDLNRLATPIDKLVKSEKSRENAEKSLTKQDVSKTELELRISKLEKAIQNLTDGNIEKNKDSNNTEVNKSVDNPKIDDAEQLLSVKKVAKEKVVNSEFIQDKNPYIKRINAATSVEALNIIIGEIENLNKGKKTTESSQSSTTKPNEELKLALQNLVNNDITTNAKFKNASPELQTQWKRARALAKKLLNDDSTTNEQLQNQIQILNQATQAIIG